jgi:hypothetical protein
MDKIVIALTPDSNKVHFLTNITSLLIPQRMNSFNKEKSELRKMVKSSSKSSQF